MADTESFDALIIGGGLAGLSVALRLAERMKVAVVAKAALTEGSSLYAQGGIAAVLNPTEDSLDSHVTDTLATGAGLCHRDVVELVVRGGPAAVSWLVAQGVPFSHGPANPHKRILWQDERAQRAGLPAFISRARADTVTGAWCTPPTPPVARYKPRSKRKSGNIPVSGCSNTTLPLTC